METGLANVAVMLFVLAAFHSPSYQTAAGWLGLAFLAGSNILGKV